MRTFHMIYFHLQCAFTFPHTHCSYVLRGTRVNVANASMAFSLVVAYVVATIECGVHITFGMYEYDSRREIKYIYFCRYFDFGLIGVRVACILLLLQFDSPIPWYPLSHSNLCPHIDRIMPWILTQRLATMASLVVVNGFGRGVANAVPGHLTLAIGRIANGELMRDIKNG